MKGQPPPEAPGNAPERLHCFQQRKVSFDPEAAEEAVALGKAFDSFGGPRAGWGAVLEELGALRAGGAVQRVAAHARQWGAPRQLYFYGVLALPGLFLTVQPSFSIPKGKTPP